jgi:hypothetical protein
MYFAERLGHAPAGCVARRGQRANPEPRKPSRDCRVSTLRRSMHICLATGGALVAESATVVSPICAAADLRLVTLIEAHGEAQDVAPEILAQAFFAAVEARKACNQGQVETAIKLYESISLRAVVSRSQ